MSVVAEVAGGSAAPSGDAKQMLPRRLNFLASSKPPSLCYDVPWGLLDPPSR